jgi:transcriptional regulator with GAF, ATPase, and Fis domain
LSGHKPGPVAGSPSSGPRGTQMMPMRREIRRIEKLKITIGDTPDQAQRGASFTFALDEVRIGAQPGLDITVKDPAMSREHLAIRNTDQGLLLTDLGSTNGTYIGDIRIERVCVQGGVTFRIGKTTLVLETLGEVEEKEMSAADRFGRMVGRSPSMREMFAVLEKVAPSDLTVLIEGETGTGKELAAEGLHTHSDRPGPFITLNCGAIPHNLIESELMGHVKGAFTGAVSDRPGAFIAANGGTVFLDEVGELPLDLQAKLLRVLEHREVKPVGSDSTVNVDVRVIAATNRNLAVESEKGAFRQDLYFRLAVVVVRIPPLRTRQDDIPMLVEHVEAELNRRRQAAGQSTNPPLGDTALAMLQRYDFPGNVRELRNIVERWVVLGPTSSPGNPAVRSGVTNQGAGEGRAGDEGQVEDSLLKLAYHEAKDAWLERFEVAYVQHALDEASGNVSRAARDAGVDRRHLQRLMSRYDIKRS